MTSMRLIAASAATAVTLGAAGAAAADSKTSSDRTIVQTAAAAGQFKTLTSLVEQAGLTDALEGKGQYTVFAPTDAAFARVPQSTLDALAKDKRKLRSVLLYHVAKGRLGAGAVAKRQSIRTLNGQRLRVRTRAGNVYVGGARVTTANVRASNGVIHVIDRVLIPR